MSVIASPIASERFVSKSFLAKFADKTANGVADIVIKTIALPDDAPIKARNIVLSKDDGVALTSSAFNGHTFAKGVAHRMALFAGGKPLAEVQSEMPELAQWAIVAGCAGLKQGAGMTVAELRNALSVALAAVLALPVKTKPKAQPAPVVSVSTSAALQNALPPVLIVEGADVRDMSAALQHSLTDAEREAAFAALVDIPAAIAAAEAAALAAAEAAALAAAEAEQEAERQRREEAMRQVMDGLTKRNEGVRVRATAFAQLANELGIKLTAAQLKALDALEGKKEAA